MHDVEIEPDRSRPLGGYAKVIVPANAIKGTEVSLTVYEMFKERFLGQDGWQPTEVAFGPYTVNNTPTHQEFIIGPEIVNHLSEFVPVRLGFGSFDAEVTWPDSVAIAPNAPPIGHAIGSDPGTAGPSTPVEEAETPPPEPAPAPPEPEPEPIPSPPEPEPMPQTGDAETSGASRMGLFIGLLVLIAVAVGAYFVWSNSQTEPEPEPEPIVEPVPEPDPEPVPEPEPEPVVEVDPCGAETLLAAEDDFSTRLESLRGCAGSVDADTALNILEAGVSAGDADALMLFGHLYNPAITDDEVEGAIGLSFSDNFEVAIDYYMRARDAGSEAATDSINQACETLRNLDPGAAEDVCE